MNTYKLLTPGPLTTSDGVRAAMNVDHCTWDDEYNQITQTIRADLLKLAGVDSATHTAVLLQGSGTYGVEAVLTGVVGYTDTLLIITNGAYGDRMIEIAKHAGLRYVTYRVPYDRTPSAVKTEAMLADHPEITHVAMVHCETTSGILNDIEAVGAVVKKQGRTFIVDAMSSFGGIPVPMAKWHISFLISSANKCIQGVPGFSFIIADKEKLIASRGKARSLSLDLYEQWKEMDKSGKWRYTSPTHVVLAFRKALDELMDEGGIKARYERYIRNNRLLLKEMKNLGIRPYIDEKQQSPIITTFFCPSGCSFSFAEMYAYIKARGYAIYPGKVTDADTFRIGNIGEIYEEDIRRLAGIIGSYLSEEVVYG